MRLNAVARIWSRVAFSNRSPASLPCQKLVIGQVLVERPHDPIAVWPLRVELVRLVTVGVGISRRVEPGHGHVLAECGTGQETIERLIDCRIKILSRQPPRTPGTLPQSAAAR